MCIHNKNRSLLLSQCPSEPKYSLKYYKYSLYFNLIQTQFPELIFIIYKKILFQNRKFKHTAPTKSDSWCLCSHKKFIAFLALSSYMGLPVRRLNDAHSIN